MARKMTEWPSKRGPITKIMPSDGCIGDTVPLAVGKWYEFHEFGWHMGNVGLDDVTIKKEVAVGMVDDKIFPEYIDLQGASTEQRQAAFFARALAAKARSVDRLYDKAGIFTFDFVAAPITGSPILAYEFSQIVGKPLFLHRQAEKFKSSAGAEIRATFDLSVRAPAAGARCLIVDDSTTGGNKVLSLLRDLKKFGYMAEDCLIVFEPKGKDARDKLSAVGVQLHTVVEGPKAINV